MAEEFSAGGAAAAAAASPSSSDASTSTATTSTDRAAAAGNCKLSVPLVKQQEFCLLTSGSSRCHRQHQRGADPVLVESPPASPELILQLGWQLRVHSYLAKFVAACGAIAFTLEALAFLAPGAEAVPSDIGSPAAQLRAAHSAEWVGFVMICAGLVNMWVKNGRVSLLVAFAANLAAITFAALGLTISCLLLATYIGLRNSSTGQELLNASLMELFVMLAQLSGLLALLVHTLGYHPYRTFGAANNRLLLMMDSAATSDAGAASTMESA